MIQFSFNWIKHWYVLIQHRHDSLQHQSDSVKSRYADHTLIQHNVIILMNDRLCKNKPIYFLGLLDVHVIDWSACEKKTCRTAACYESEQVQNAWENEEVEGRRERVI